MLFEGEFFEGLCNCEGEDAVDSCGDESTFSADVVFRTSSDMVTVSASVGVTSMEIDSSGFTTDDSGFSVIGVLLEAAIGGASVGEEDNGTF